MKTFETEKHNIPEGATHCIDETCVHRFSWGKYIGDDLHLRLPGDIEWTNVENKFFSGVVVEIKKPRTKTEFVKIEYNHAWEIIKLHEDGEELFKTDSDELQIERINSIALRAQAGYPFYRKVETEIDERQEFIEVACEKSGLSKHSVEAQVFGVIFDSGEFKLVEK